MNTEAPNESITPNTTPTGSGDAGTTPPAAASAGTTPNPEGGNQVDIDKIVKQRLERERKKWEAESEEAAKRARMDEAERLKADIADRDKRIAEAEAKATAADRRASLTGKVADPQAALRLLDDAHVNDDGTVNIDALLTTYPFLAPTPTGPTATRGAAGGAMPRGKDPTKMTDEEYFRSRTEQKE